VTRLQSGGNIVVANAAGDGKGLVRATHAMMQT
jgi:hypothetical protein